MITHYLKVAVRNLLKYKTQSVISILGLAVGFLCFALASLWIHYEMAYDDFHEGADRIYCVRLEDKRTANGLSPITPYPLAGYLKETFAEVEGACSLQCHESEYKVDGREVKLNELSLDSAAFSVFNIRLVKGSIDFLLPGQRSKAAITRRCTQRLFGSENPIGKEIASVYNPKNPITICAIVSEWPEHSNLNYDIINRTYAYDKWGISSWQTFIRLHPQTDKQAFTDKLYNHVIEKENITLKNIVATPLTALRYDRPDEFKEANITLKYVVMFAVAGALVILCSLLNYLTLFVSHIRMRSKELALRMVNGASNGSLFALLITEYLILLFAALLVGMLFIEIIQPVFRELAQITLSMGSIYLESALYCLAVILLASLLSTLPIVYYRRKSIQSVISNQKNGRDKNLFRKVSVVFQLFISIGFIFCASLMMKQLFYLTHADHGMTRKNIAAVLLNSDKDVEAIADFLRQQPEVEEVLPWHHPLITIRGSLVLSAQKWEDMPNGAEPVQMTVHSEDTAFARFYGLTLLEGEMITPSTSLTDIVLNEAAVRALGWHEAIGKTLSRDDSTAYRVIGVMKDFYTETPTMPVQPCAFTRKYEIGGGFAFDFNEKNNILIKFKEGTWETCKKKFEEHIQAEYPDSRNELKSAEEKYAEYLTSETALLKLLGMLAVVCTLLSVFAIYSLVALTCEQRRKEIAIRKVNGATIRDILQMFVKEYAVLLAVAALLSFPVAYLLMKQWLENYSRQTTVSWWLFLSILGGIALVVAASIGLRVWKAANENPAEVVKSE